MQRVTLCFIAFHAFLFINCKHASIETPSTSSRDSTDYIEAFFCCDYDEREVTLENYEALLDSIGAALDSLSSPSRCVTPMAEMNAVLLKVDSITKPEGFMDRKGRIMSIIPRCLTHWRRQMLMIRGYIV